MAVINFQDYRINRMSYQKNEQFDYNIEKIEFNNEISFRYEIDEEESNAIVWIDFSAGDLEGEQHPFYIDIEIQGYFSYSKEEDETEAGFEKFIKNNCLAILYPYLRSTVANVTNIANDFPTYNLPTINITKAIQENNDN